MGLKLFFKRMYEEYRSDAVADSAAALSYYFVFSLFPLLFFLVALAAYLPFVRESVTTTLDRLHPILPQQVMGIVETHLRGLVTNQQPHLLTVGAAVTLYTASRGVDAFRKALNVAYGVQEWRPFWRTEMIAIGLTIGGALLSLIGVTALVAGGDAGLWVARRLNIAKEYVMVWGWLRWPITAAVVMFAAALGYHFLPAVKQRWRYFTVGSIAGTATWMVASWGFAQYVAHFGRYNVMYGSIGGVIVLMTWFYITGFLFLMGGEANAIIRREADRIRD
jgi:membrane protein